jgi:exopolysaccharide biosynthesis polyprenyl glycosylphosphotransferase
MSETRLERDRTRSERPVASRFAPTAHTAASRRRRLSRFDGPDTSTILRRDATYRRLLAVGDAGALLLATKLVMLARGGGQPGPALILLPVLAIVIAKLLGLYDRDELLLHKSTLDEGGTLFQMSTLLTLLASIGDQQILGENLGARDIFALWGLTFICALIARYGARTLASHLVAPERCLVIGHRAGVSAIGARLEVEGGINAVLVGELHIDSESDPSNAMYELAERVESADVHRVILATREADHEVVLDLVRMIKRLGVKVSVLPRLFEVVGSSMVFDSLGGMTVLGMRRFGLSRSSAAIKRTMDLVGSGLALVIAGPVMAVIAIAIKMDSPGPVFFRQQRVGKHGHVFEMRKFRTMVKDADTMKADLMASLEIRDGLFKLADDPRQTRVGRLLRSTSLDELPQIINVLRGDMSLVGPRPLVVDEDRLILGWQRGRLQLTPGMTGPWQILGSRSQRVPLHEMVNMDYLYVAGWSFFTDIKIMLRTVLHMLRRSGV